MLIIIILIIGVTNDANLDMMKHDETDEINRPTTAMMSDFPNSRVPTLAAGMRKGRVKIYGRYSGQNHRQGGEDFRKN